MTPEIDWWRQGLETALAIDGWMSEGELRQDAVLAFDDADLEDVDRVIRDACRSRLLEPLGREGKLAWFLSGTSRDT